MTIDIQMSECGVLFELDISETAAGPLQGKTFVVKDLFDVEGFVTGGGNPDWRRNQKESVKHAFAVKLLLDASAHLIGKSCTDELALSLDGINPYYGVPLNSQLPERIPGGSSSGSASAAAAGFCDFGLGTDTVGSVRVPASYCGLYGFRPTHGVIDLAGCMPLGQSFDTVGWLCSDVDLLYQVGKVLLPEKQHEPINQIVRLFKYFKGLPEELATPFRSACHAVAEQSYKANVGAIEDVVIDDCVRSFSIVRSREAWANYGSWIESLNPRLSPSVMQRLIEGKTVSAGDEHQAREVIAKETDFLEEYIDTAGALLLPTTRNFPPLRSASQVELDENRKLNIRLTIIATVAGLPQVTLPVEISPGVSLGISLIGPRGRDLDLLEFAKRVSLRRSI